MFFHHNDRSVVIYMVLSRMLTFSWKQILFLHHTTIASLKTRALLLKNHLVAPVGGGEEQSGG